MVDEAIVVAGLLLSGASTILNGIVVAYLTYRLYGSYEGEQNVWGAIASLVNGLLHVIKAVDLWWAADAFPIFRIQYLDYMLSCPLIMLDFATTLALPQPRIQAVLTMMALFCAVLGYASHSPFVWFFLGSLILGSQFLLLGRNFLKRPWLHRTAFITLVTTWLGFPLVFVLGKGYDWPDNQVQLGNAILDVVAKTGVAFALYRIEKRTIIDFHRMMGANQEAKEREAHTKTGISDGAGEDGPPAGQVTSTEHETTIYNVSASGLFDDAKVLTVNNLFPASLVPISADVNNEPAFVRACSTTPVLALRSVHSACPIAWSLRHSIHALHAVHAVHAVHAHTVPSRFLSAACTWCSANDDASVSSAWWRKSFVPPPFISIPDLWGVTPVRRPSCQGVHVPTPNSRRPQQVRSESTPYRDSQ